MKPKKLFTTLLLAAATSAHAQYFNRQLTNFLFPAYHSNVTGQSIQAITLDRGGNGRIILFTINNSTGKEMELIKLDANGNRIDSKTIFNPIGDTLIPRSIITTRDSGLLLVGDYIGQRIHGFPGTGTVYTIFFAKYDKNFNRVWFNLLNAYPINVQNNSAYITSNSVVAVTDSLGYESYIILSYGGYRGISFNTYYDISLTKVNAAGSITKEIYVTLPNELVLKNLGSISYLPTGNICAITGSLNNFTSHIIPNPVEPFIFTVDPYLNNISAIQRYRYSPLQTYGDYTSNVIEDPSRHGYAYLSFISDYTFPVMHCNTDSANRSLIVLNFRENNPLIISQQYSYIPQCLINVTPPLTLKNVQSNSNIMIGYTDEVQIPGTNNLAASPALLQLNNSGSVVSYHRYNTADQNNFMQTFTNYMADSFIASINIEQSSTLGYTRVLKTDILGKDFCADSVNVSYKPSPYYAVDTFPIQSPDTFLAIPIFPTDSVTSFATLPCDSDFQKPAPSGIPNVVHGKIAIDIYPNPANDVLNIDIKNPPSGAFFTRIINAVGQIKIEIPLSSGTTDLSQTTIDVSKLNAGYYYLQIANGNGTMTVKPFIKR